MKTNLDQQSLEGKNALVTGASPDQIGVRSAPIGWIGRGLGEFGPQRSAPTKVLGLNYAIT